MTYRIIGSGIHKKYNCVQLGHGQLAGSRYTRASLYLLHGMKLRDILSFLDTLLNKKSLTHASSREDRIR
jgi:hypothetical protein